MALDKIRYTTEVTVTGGRDGEAVSSDGRLKLKLTRPKGLGGGEGEGTNPEQLFAAGYAACFLSAMQHVAAVDKITISPNASITSQVSLGFIGQAFALAVTLNVKVPGMEQAAAEALVAKAHQTCPYSNATRNNVEVTLVVSVE